MITWQVSRDPKKGDWEVVNLIDCEWDKKRDMGGKVCRVGDFTSSRDMTKV